MVIIKSTQNIFIGCSIVDIENGKYQIVKNGKVLKEMMFDIVPGNKYQNKNSHFTSGNKKKSSDKKISLDKN